MLKAIIYKEWLKTRNVFFIGLLLSVCIAGFDILSMNRVATMKGVEHIWQIMLMKDNMFVNHLAFVPIAVGLGISLAQMLPEMAQKRLKLTLHLPYSQNKMILAMLAVGLVEILVVSLITILMVVCYDSAILVPELVTRVVLTMAPWFVGGVATYLVTAAVCIESCLHPAALCAAATRSFALYRSRKEAHRRLADHADTRPQHDLPHAKHCFRQGKIWHARARTYHLYAFYQIKKQAAAMMLSSSGSLFLFIIYFSSLLSP